MRKHGSKLNSGTQQEGTPLNSPSYKVKNSPPPMTPRDFKNHKFWDKFKNISLASTQSLFFCVYQKYPILSSTSKIYIISHWIVFMSFCWYVTSTLRLRSPSNQVQCNLNKLTTCDLVTMLQRPFVNLLHKSIWFSDIMRFSDSFCQDQKCH